MNIAEEGSLVGLSKIHGCWLVGLLAAIDPAKFDAVPLAFDNMDDRQVKGNTDELLLDVPPEASLIALGSCFAAKGVVWLDELDHPV